MTRGRRLAFVVSGVNVNPMLTWIERRSDDASEHLFWMAFYVQLVLAGSPSGPGHRPDRPEVAARRKAKA